MFEGLGGKSGAGLPEQAFGAAQLGVGSALRFTVLSVAADFATDFTEGGVYLLHRTDAMAVVIMLGLCKRRVGIVQQCRGAGRLGVGTGHEPKSQKQDGKQG